MAVASSCPSSEQLRQLLLGQVDLSLLDGMERHVHDCPNCATLLPTLSGNDALIGSIRARTSSLVEQGEIELVEDLMVRLQKNQPCLAGDTTVGSWTPAGGPNEADTDRDLCAFLKPAEGSGELGRLETFRIIRVLGRGGMGVVFEAEDTRLKRAVAVKAMLPRMARKPQASERFLREARAAAALQHDHVVAVYHVGVEGGVPYLVMPLLQGASLADSLLSRESGQPVAALSVSAILRLGREIAAGLAAAHQVGLIHRDIKPANIWLDAAAGGRAKILDFGLARPAGDDEQLSSPGLVVGTPCYMSPEQAQGKPVDGRADLFSLGCVLYQLAAGRLPFKGTDAVATLLIAATEEPPPLEQLNPELPPALSALIRRLLAKSPVSRPSSAQAVVEEIERIERDLAAGRESRAVDDRTITVAAEFVRPRRWRRIAVAATLCLVAGLVAAQVIIRITDKDGKVREVPIGPGAKIELIPQESVETGTAKMPEEDWLKHVAAQPAGKQAEMVTGRLKDLNPGFTGPATPIVQNGVVSELFLSVDKLADLRPVRSLTGLVKLDCTNPTQDQYGDLKDLAPLNGMKLTEALTVRGAKIDDLSPLQGMSLKVLSIEDTRVSNLAPLRGMALTELRCNKTSVSDLSVLKTLPLQVLKCDFKPDRDAAILKSHWTLQTINDEPAVDFWKKVDPQHAAHLQWIEETKKLPAQIRIDVVKAKLIERNPDFADLWKATIKNGEVLELAVNTDHIVDLSPLRAFPRLSDLHCHGSYPRHGKLADLSPLQGLPLVHLECMSNPPLRDLTPLGHLPLKYLNCSQTNANDLAPLRGLRLQRFLCYYSGVKDLTPLVGMPLMQLNISGCKAADLSPLRDLPLELLSMKQTLVRDLSPLSGTPLKWLECTLMTAPSFAPLRKTPIREIICEHPEKQTATLSTLWSLDKINEAPALEFFKQHNPVHAAFLQWIAETRQLPADEQVKQVKSKVKERNPNLDLSRVEAVVLDQRVNAVSLPAAEVTDLAPRAPSPTCGCSTAPARRASRAR